MTGLPTHFWQVCAIVLGLIGLGGGLSLAAALRRKGTEKARASLGPRFLVWVAAAAVLLACMGLGAATWTALLAALALFAASELSAAFRAAGWRADALAAPLGAVGCVAVALAPEPWRAPGLLAITVAAVALALTRGGVRALAPTAAAAVYVGVPLALLSVLERREQGFELVVWTLLVVILTDVTAMFGGMFFGRRRMAPKISPNKTWEGSAAGLLGALAAAAVVYGIFRAPLPAPYYAAAVAVGIADILGDLAASWVKRTAGVKDFSAALPGHGGVMDRIDGLLLAAPAAWLLAPLVAR